MLKKPIMRIITLVLAGVVLLAGCGTRPTDSQLRDEVITITDMANRQVVLNKSIERAVAIGPGALRLYLYINGMDKLVGVEQCEINSAAGKPYNMANPELNDLPVIGPGGPQNPPDPEKILAVGPDVIFSTYGQDSATADNLQAQTGIPVVELSYGAVSVFDPAVYQSLSIIGKIMDREPRAQEVVAYMENCYEDLYQRTFDIANKDKPRVYMGALNARGSHGIESTQGRYALLDALHAVNVADETGKTGSFMIDREKLLEWNPDIICIDAGGFAMVRDDYNKNPEFYQALTAVQKGQLYRQLPYNFYTTNIDTALADAYFLGKIIYPGQFADIEPDIKADEIYQVLLGASLYQQMCRDFGPFAQVSLD